MKKTLLLPWASVFGSDMGVLLFLLAWWSKFPIVIMVNIQIQQLFVWRVLYNEVRLYETPFRVIVTPGRVLQEVDTKKSSSLQCQIERKFYWESQLCNRDSCVFIVINYTSAWHFIQIYPKYFADTWY